MAGSKRSARARTTTGELPFRGRNWGGRRPGAGRKPKGDRPGVPHRPRAALASRFPVHVTVKLRRGLPRLRAKAPYRVLRGAFEAACERKGFRVVHYSVQNDHVHLLVEAKGRESLSRGMQGLLIRIARRLNRLWGRKGSVFADRYHDRILRTPRQVRAALVYVLHNARRHGMRLKKAIDVFSSGPWFDGWRERVVVRGLEDWARPVAMARTWLLGVGWRRGGLVGLEELPAAARGSAR